MPTATEIGTDATADIALRLQPEVASSLEALAAKITRYDTSSVGIAVTSFAFPRLAIAVDAEFFCLEELTQSFVIAHELSHVAHKDPVVLRYAPLGIGFAIGTIAVQLSLKVSFALGLVVLLFGGGLLTLALIHFIGFIERRADRYAASLVGITPAIGALRELSATLTVRAAKSSVSTNLDNRIESLRNYGVKIA